jgi:hypothetical protein
LFDPQGSSQKVPNLVWLMLCKWEVGEYDGWSRLTTFYHSTQGIHVISLVLVKFFFLHFSLMEIQQNIVMIVCSTCFISMPLLYRQNWLSLYFRIMTNRWRSCISLYLSFFIAKYSQYIYLLFQIHR